MKLATILSLIMVSISASYALDPKLDTLFKLSDLERILPLGYVSVTQIHPAIAEKLDAHTIESIEGKLKTVIPQNIFTASIQEEFGKKFQEMKYARLKAIFLDPTLMKFQEANKHWNSPAGQKQCADNRIQILEATSVEKQEFAKKYLDRQKTMEKTLDLFDMALGAQIDLIHKVQANPKRLTKREMQDLAKKYRDDIIDKSKEGIVADHYCLFYPFSMEELSRIYDLEGKKESVWFDEIVWNGLRQGYLKAKQELGK